jgi:hypothetical protein
VKLKDEPEALKIRPRESYTYSVPHRGVSSTRFKPQYGCDAEGNDCDVQSTAPCPANGCSPEINTKFEASFGCKYWKGNAQDGNSCDHTGQGLPNTYQDWWDGSAVDGWTFPFSVLVDDGGMGLSPYGGGSSPQCGPVVCAGLDVEDLCPKEEFLTPET